MNYAEMIRNAMNKMQALMDKAKTESRDLNDEELEVFNALDKEVKDMKAKFDREKRIEDIRNDLNTPVTPAPVVNVTLGQHKNKWERPGDFFNAVRLAGMPSHRVDNRLVIESGAGTPQNATGMSIAVGGDGGFMVGAENEQWLMEAVRADSQVFSRVTPIPIGDDKNGTTIPSIVETSRVNGSRFGGVQAYWASEAGTVAATKPTFRNVDIRLEKLLAFCYMTEELLSDTRAMEAFVQMAFGSEMAFKLDDGVLNGDGNGRMLGILNCPALISVDKKAGQQADTIVWENVRAMWYRLRARSKSRSVWLINPEAEEELSDMTKIVGTGGVPVYLPAGGASVSPYGSLFGRPVIPCEQCAAKGDKGDIILADLSDYIAIDKGGLATDSSIHVQFLYDEMCFRFRYRVNGTPYTKSPVTPYKGTATTSPYVAIAARA
jgi:HK97 family phage major capsid protein